MLAELFINKGDKMKKATTKKASKKTATKKAARKYKTTKRK